MLAVRREAGCQAGRLDEAPRTTYEIAFELDEHFRAQVVERNRLATCKAMPLVNHDGKRNAGDKANFGVLLYLVGLVDVEEEEIRSGIA